MSGVRTIADLKDRCRVDEITGCWVWAGGNDGKGFPCLWLPSIRRRTSLGVALCVLITGEPPAPGVVWHSVCGTNACANPEHRRAGTRQSQMQAHAGPITASHRAAITAARRAQSSLSDADVRAIRDSDAAPKQIAAEFGISPSYVSLIRRGKSRLELSRGASIFNLGARAHLGGL